MTSGFWGIIFRGIAVRYKFTTRSRFCIVGQAPLFVFRPSALLMLIFSCGIRNTSPFLTVRFPCAGCHKADSHHYCNYHTFFIHIRLPSYSTQYKPSEAAFSFDRKLSLLRKWVDFLPIDAYCKQQVRACGHSGLPQCCDDLSLPYFLAFGYLYFFQMPIFYCDAIP